MPTAAAAPSTTAIARPRATSTSVVPALEKSSPASFVSARHVSAGEASVR